MTTLNPATPAATPPPPPSPADAAAAHYFLCELRTRISTQPLPYQYGIESRAMESLWEVFAQAREAMKRHPGCGTFAAAVTHVLNADLRPVTAKWHRAYADGRLNAKDGADEFRADLAGAQEKLRAFAGVLHEMAYGTSRLDAPTPPALTPEELEDCFLELPFGISKGLQIADCQVEEINQSELQAVQDRRRAYQKADKAVNAVGLAFSGGGIRSATFCLGVTQVLAERGLLQDVDFLSTVSGGGYTGSFITTRLGTGTPEADLGGPRGPDPAPIRYLRQRAKFLAASNFRQSWSMVTATFAGLLLNWTVPLVLIFLAAIIATQFAGALENVWPAALGTSAGLTALSLVLYCGMMRNGRNGARVGGAFVAVFSGLTLLVGAAWLLDWGYDWVTAPGRITGVLSALAGALVVAAPMVVRFVPVLKNPKLRKIVLKVLLILAGIVLPLIGLALFYVACAAANLPHNPTAPQWNPLHYFSGRVVLMMLTSCLALISIVLLNINLTAPHRLYRDALAQPFVQSSDTDTAAKPLQDINPTRRAPYHLLNTALNVPSSQSPALRDRRCEFFMFSKYWCGSAVTKYHPTNKWKTNGQKADLATAMAVSGAAASSHMGLGSMPSLTALLTFLNVRLGFWISRPDRKIGWPKTPGFSCLLREMTSVGMHENHAWLNLSDGGHIENMAIYELLRRRCKFILCVDGEADPQFTFVGLMTAIRHVQIDFGVRIEPRLNEVRPDATTGQSQRHGVFCRIHYPKIGDQPAATGLLLYLKLSVTGNESELIKRYRITNPDFPHQTTLDQFFDQEQFEAYRQLGVHVTEGFFSPALMNHTGKPPTFAKWFRHLGANLLEPEHA